MNELLKLLKAFLPKLNENQLKGIVSLLGIGNKEVGATDDENTVTPVSIVKSLTDLGYTVSLPGKEDAEKTVKGKGSPFAYEQNPVTPVDEEEGEEKNATQKAMNAAYALRFSDEDVAMKAIMTDILGPSFQQTMYEQDVAFAKYIRGGERRLNNKELKLLDIQIFPMKHIKAGVIDGGLDVRTIKATQIESQGELGGFAIPPQRQNTIETRLPGYTAVRGGGANVISLITGSSTEIPQWRTDDTTDQRYIGMIRGERGKETATPNAKNFKLDMVPLIAYLYTFKVPLSQSLVEDSANVVSTLMEDITTVIAMDEDEEFLVGDGVAKAEGILPGGLNANSLKEVISGSAAALTVAGIKNLKRGVASQYRKNCGWYATSATYGILEAFTAGAGNTNWAFPDLSEEDRLLARPVFESEVIPEVAANTYPIIFAWMRGYDIVERLGMTIQRFQDSATGPNVVEYHVRKRFGGKLEKPWMFAVQKVSA